MVKSVVNIRIMMNIALCCLDFPYLTSSAQTQQAKLAARPESSEVPMEVKLKDNKYINS